MLYIYIVGIIFANQVLRVNGMLCRTIIIAVVLALAVAGDILRYRISNAVVAAGLSAGFLINILTCGMDGLLKALAGALLPAVLLFVLFALRMLGAGDIKLFCTIGAVMGAEFIAYAIALSFISGGVMALILMLARGNLKRRLTFAAAWVKTVLFSQTFIPYTDFSDKSDGAKFHFSPAIAAGCLIQATALLLF